MLPLQVVVRKVVVAAAALVMAATVTSTVAAAAAAAALQCQSGVELLKVCRFLRGVIEWAPDIVACTTGSLYCVWCIVAENTCTECAYNRGGNPRGRFYFLHLLSVCFTWLFAMDRIWFDRYCSSAPECALASDYLDCLYPRLSLCSIFSSFFCSPIQLYPR